MDDRIPESRAWTFTDEGRHMRSDDILEQARASGPTEYNKWHVNVTEQRDTTPDIKIRHIHAPFKNLPAPGTSLPSIDMPCTCGKTLPPNIIEEAISLTEKSMRRSLYAGVDIPFFNRNKDMKYLATNWFLDTRYKRQFLFHICNENHPAYLYYGRGIPLNQVAWPPHPNVCKTCKVEIPKGVLVALLMMNQKVSLK